MSDAELWAAWRIWIAVAVVLVVVAASLLIAIWWTARRILAEALRALAAAEAIQKSTGVIWELKVTNEVAERILRTVQAIEHKGGALSEALNNRGVTRR